MSSEAEKGVAESVSGKWEKMGRYRLLIISTFSATNGGALSTSDVVEFDNRKEAEEVFKQIKHTIGFKVLRLYPGEGL